MMTLSSYCDDRLKRAKSKYASSMFIPEKYDFYEALGYFIKNIKDGTLDEMLDIVKRECDNKLSYLDVNLIANIVHRINVQGYNIMIFNSRKDYNFDLVNKILSLHPVYGRDIITLLNSYDVEESPMKDFRTKKKLVNKSHKYYIVHNNKTDDFYLRESLKKKGSKKNDFHHKTKGKGRQKVQKTM